jgi:ubiquinone/menaquinone biosynthesis C-methylase UbiE
MEKQVLYNKDYFEGNFHTSSGIERTLLSFKPIAHSFNKNLKPSRILDIGCAKGFLVSLFHSFGVESYGVDISSYAVSRAPEEIKKNLFVLDVEKGNLPFPDNYFDLLTMIDILEHLHFSSINHILKEIKRVLKQNGYICLTLPTPQEEKKDITHINLRPKSFWIDFFQERGFIIASNQKELLKKESQKYIWDNKRYFINLYRKLLKSMPPSGKLGKFLIKRRGGNIIREIFWLSDYFFFRNKNYFDKKMILFKKL